MVFSSVVPVLAKTDNRKVQWLVDKKYVEGYEDGSLKLENTITRAEFTKMVVFIQGEKALADKLKSVPSVFSDVSVDHWANGYINDAVKQGYILGYEDGTFKPENNITNEEVITILARLHPDFVEMHSKGVDWSRPYVLFAIGHGILNDISLKNGALKEDATRELVFEMIYNYIHEVFEKAKDTETDKKPSDSSGSGNSGGSSSEKPTYYTVRFYVDGELVARRSFKSGNYLTLPSIPEKEGYEFLGWYSGSVKYGTSDRVRQNLDLTAKFMKIEDNTDPEEPTPEEQVKINFEAAVSNSIEKIDTGDVSVEYNNKNATITLPADMTDFTAFGHGILTQLRSLVNNHGLQSYKIGDNEVNLAEMNSIYEAVEPIIRDFAGVAKVDMSDLTDFTNANNEAISAKVAEILQKLAKEETPITATLRIKQEGTETTDTYTLNFKQEEVTEPEDPAIYTVTLKDYIVIKDMDLPDINVEVQAGKTLKDGLELKDDGFGEISKIPFEKAPQNEGYEVLNMTDENGNVFDPDTTPIHGNKTITVNWTPTEEAVKNQLKSELNTAVDNSVKEVAANIGNASLMFNKANNTATLVLPTDLSTVTTSGTGIGLALKNMIENNALQSYRINGDGFEEKSFVDAEGHPRSEVISDILNDLSTAAGVGEDADIQTLLNALKGKTVTTTVTMKKTVDGREITATDEYTLVVPKDMEEAVAKNIENNFNNFMGSDDKPDTAVYKVNNNKNKLTNDYPMFNVHYDTESREYKADINNLALETTINGTRAYGFKTLIIDFLTGDHVGRDKSTIGNLKQVVVKTEDGSKSAILNTEQLATIQKGNIFFMTSLISMFESVFIPEDKTASTLTLGDLNGNTFAFVNTYVDEETNEAYTVTRTMTFGTFPND